MPVEFISAVHTDSGASGPAAASRTGFDRDHLRRYARALDDGGFDHTLVAYHSRRRRTPSRSPSSSRPTPNASARSWRTGRASSFPRTRPAPSPLWTGSATGG
ncbi:hypothetical protein QF027_000963 [Streptomyces canus]|nr:hypothetical protein [Streptomyces canus]